VVSLDFACASLYLLAHQAWAWAFRASLEPWVRRWIARRLETSIVWVPATTFPVDVWAWGAGESGDSQRDARLAAWCAALCLFGAFVPVAVLVVLLDRFPCPTRLSEVLYLMTIPTMVAFVRVQTGRREGPDRTELPRLEPGRPVQKLRNDSFLRIKTIGGFP
jgi:hypothetical protein